MLPSHERSNNGLDGFIDATDEFKIQTSYEYYWK